MPTVETLHRSRDFLLADWCCDAARGAGSEPESVRACEVVFVRRGAFSIRVGSDEFLVTPAEALLLAPGVEYRVSHPLAGGDDCTVIGVSGEAAGELAEGLRARTAAIPVPVPPALFAAHWRLLAAARSARASALEQDERLLSIAGAVLGPAAARTTSNPQTGPARRAVARARELIAGHFTEPLSLADVGEAVGVSSFHLARNFRRLTGTTLHAWQTELRLRAAMDRLMGGAADLARVALELGFSSHGHFTTAFKSRFGSPPSAFRTAEACRRLQWWRRPR